ncbi:hypothetical protein KHP62_12805 [Rhodobacteraceae bacterium NNCM2]|nr:hypothetical protein [Coraliihabitans acroporae]
MSHSSRLAGMIIDCKTDDVRGAASFWAAALGSAMEAEGLAGSERYIQLDRQGGLHLEVQAVDHAPRVHLDIETDNIRAEVARLEHLGARTVSEVKKWVVMEAPTGHRFCVVPAESADFYQLATKWEG